MRYRIVLLLVLILFLCGCSSAGEQNGPSAEADNSAYEGFRLTARRINGMVETQQGLYVVVRKESGHSSTNYVYYTDKDTMGPWIPLCDKPDCLHNSPDCNSFAGDAGQISLYENHIYYVENEMIFRMDLTGENHSFCKNLLPDHSGPCGWGFTLQHGCAFLRFEDDSAESPGNAAYLVPFTGKDTQKILDLPKDEGLFAVSCRDRILFSAYSGEGGTQLYVPASPVVPLDETRSLLDVYAMNMDETGHFLEAVAGDGVYQLDLSSGEKQKLADWFVDPETERIFFDETYYYSGPLGRIQQGTELRTREPGGELTVRDKDLNVVQVIPLPEDKSLYLYAITDDYLLFFEGFFGCIYDTPVCYLEKAKIGTPECELKYFE